MENMARSTYLERLSRLARAWSITPRKKGQIFRKLIPQAEKPTVRKKAATVLPLTTTPGSRYISATYTVPTRAMLKKVPETLPRRK